MASVAGECIKIYLRYDAVEVRTAALWVIINLTEGCADHYVISTHFLKSADAS